MTNQIIDDAIQEICSKLKCCKCPNVIQEPKLLPCYHIFCKSPCLERLVVQGPEGQSLTCPICEYQVTLPDNGVAGLPADYQKEHLLKQKESLEKAKNPKCENCRNEPSPASKYCAQCKKYMCDKCRRLHETWEAFRDHRSDLFDINEVKARAPEIVISERQPLTCEKHPTMDLRLYCKTCPKLICADCTVKCHRFQDGHEYDLVDDVFEDHKNELESSLEPLGENLGKVDQALNDFGTLDTAIDTQRDKIEASIREEIQELKKLLDQRQAELLGSLNRQAQGKHQLIARQIKEAKIMQAKMSSCLQYAKSGLSLRSSTKSDVLRIKAPVLKRIEEITAEFDPNTLQPRTEADVELVTDAEARKTCQEFGKVVYDPISAEKSYCTGIGVDFAMKGVPTKVEVHPKTKRNEISEGDFQLKTKLVHIKTGATFKCDTTHTNGRHTISYQPVNRGRHSLHIGLNGSHIQGSPFPVAVILSPESFHNQPERVVTIEDSGLYGVTVNSEGKVIVTERDNRCISVLNLREDVKFSFGNDRMKHGFLRYPSGVAVDHEDNIYVVDGYKIRQLPLTSDHIVKFNSNGEFVAIAGGGDLQFSRPVGICFNKIDNLLYVCDQENHRIQVLTTDLAFVRSFGKKGTGDGQFDCPMNLAFDSNNNLYVTDSKNDRVQVFTSTGEFVRAFSEKGDEKVLARPNAIAIDSSDVVYVSEDLLQCVSLFRSQGKYFASFGTEVANGGPFTAITGLCIDGDDRIHVSDSLTNKLQIF